MTIHKRPLDEFSDPELLDDNAPDAARSPYDSGAAFFYPSPLRGETKRIGRLILPVTDYFRLRKNLSYDTYTDIL